ncbi:hypothetical protein GCM10023195_51520 [Actinoallomurus liliacearum]|uniref:Uncharacterized protein n=1 Tax=Actinoallomurus liliacearum TaxID=1080073 RepID=A0ABP8TMU4_9ACTN
MEVSVLSPFARRGFGLVTGVPRNALGVGRALLDLHPRRQRRQVWAEHGHAYIDVRGIDGDGRAARDLAGHATAAVRHLRGVRWAEINAVTGQMLVAYDERRVGVDRLLATIRKVEDDRGTSEEGFSWTRPAHPGDGAPIAVATTELAVDCVAVLAAVAEKVFALPPVPRWIRLPLALPDLSPGVRRRIDHRIGPIETELVLALANAVVHGMSAGILPPAVDALYRSLLLGETWSRRQVWRRREPELCSGSACVPSEAPDRPPRPRPRPGGPVEKWCRVVESAALGATAATLALTRQPGRAGDTILVMVPKAATYGREGFAAVTAWRLAGRGILPLDAGAYRRLDRVSAIVIDSAVLRSGHLPAPIAGAVLDAARATGAKVFLTDRSEAADLHPLADEMLGVGTGLTAHVRRLQEEGHTVLVVSEADCAALAAADVGVAVPAPGSSTCWSGDLICRARTGDVWYVLRAVAAARPVSERGVRLAQAGSALGVLLAFAGPRRTSGPGAITATYLAALLALLWGAAAGLRVTMGTAPVRVPARVAIPDVRSGRTATALTRAASRDSPRV